MIWQRFTETRPPGLLRLRQGETIDDALRRAMQQSPDNIQSIWIPSWLAEGPIDEALAPPDGRPKSRDGLPKTRET